MVAVRQDVIVEEARTFEFVVDLLDEDNEPRTDLAGYSGAMQIRDQQAPDATLLGTAVVTIDTVNSQATATIADTVTAEYGWSAGWYDLEISNSTRTEGIAYGRARLRRNVTT